MFTWALERRWVSLRSRNAARPIHPGQWSPATMNAAYSRQNPPASHTFTRPEYSITRRTAHHDSGRSQDHLRPAVSRSHDLDDGARWKVGLDSSDGLVPGRVEALADVREAWKSETRENVDCMITHGAHTGSEPILQIGVNVLERPVEVVDDR